MVKIHKSKYGYDVVCPTLPGCASQGDTEEEALENIKDAIRGYLLAAKKVRRGEKLAKVLVFPFWCCFSLPSRAGEKLVVPMDFFRSLF